MCACVVSLESDAALGPLAAFANGCCSPPVCTCGHARSLAEASEASGSARAKQARWALLRKRRLVLGPWGLADAGSGVSTVSQLADTSAGLGRWTRPRLSAKGSEWSGQEGSRAPRDDGSGAVSGHGPGRAGWTPLDAGLRREKAFGEVADPNNHT